MPPVTRRQHQARRSGAYARRAVVTRPPTGRGWWLLLVVAAVIIGLGGSGSSEQPYQQLISQQRRLVSATVQAFQAKAYLGGVWDPPVNRTAQPDGFWQKEQWPAVSLAVLSRLPNPPEGAAASASATVNAMIAAHQRPDGSFDAGPPRSVAQSVVGGTFWAMAEGTIATVLADGHEVSPATLRAWEQSMARYAAWLESSGNARFYVNGNDNLRMALILLETWQLAMRVGDPTAPRLLGDYRAEQSFVTDPGWPPPGTFGWHRAGRTGWFSETPPGSGQGNWFCANRGPCTGFDPYYVTLQLNDALMGYVISGRDRWWRSIVESEFAAELPRINAHGGLDASNGSRHNDAGVLFDPNVYPVLSDPPLDAHDQLWAAQLAALKAQYARTERPPAASLGPNDYAFVESPAVGLLDSITR